VIKLDNKEVKRDMDYLIAYLEYGTDFKHIQKKLLELQNKIERS